MEAATNCKPMLLSDCTGVSNGAAGGRSRSGGTQSSTSPARKSPGGRSRSNTVGSNRGLDVVVYADASAKAVFRYSHCLVAWLSKI